MASHEVIDLTELTESSEGEGGSETSDDDEDLPLNEVSRAQLHYAISTVSERRLREVVAELVDNIPALEHAMTKEFVTLKRGTQEVVLRWESCVNCDEQFDVNTVRHDDECSFHPGRLQVA
jgi:hypothetical protein